MERNGKILWADDEIDLLKPHIMFLKAKGYDVTTVNNGADALDSVSQSHFDLVILDENMPGLSGLETLSQIKQMRPDVPVIMITKSEEENIMNQAIGNKIADYLIKPVNPNQILMSLKKNLHSSTLVSQQATSDYQQEFRRITEQINDSSDITDWYNLYRKLVFWEMELAQTDTNMDELLLSQKSDANAQFCKYIKRNYESWIDSESRPLMSNDVFKRKVFPLLDAGEKVFFVLIDNFRLDQWRIIKPLLAEYYNIEE